ncbi:MAG: hypothetical protein MZU84_00695 [Sphingobacterium sp.]|nr:hypothetical protein [Sphingobacterium sp.]
MKEMGMTTIFVRRKRRGKILNSLTVSARVPACATSETAVICHEPVANPGSDPDEPVEGVIKGDDECHGQV